jgi:anti-sigma28 factor (negative regulator of flagellin synthesis)
MSVDATGKVGKRQAVLDEAVRVTTAGGNPGRGASVAGSGSNGDPAIVDKVDLRLAKTIQENLNPSTLSAERSEKIAKLKEMIAAGTYKPSTEDIAKAVTQELAQEIYFGQSSSDDETSVFDVLGGSRE